jgi:hypothetical protein
MPYYLGTKTYCDVCGAKQVDEWHGEYSTETGEKYLTKVCPNNPCGHGRHRWEGIKQSVLKSMFFHDEKCARCGITRRSPEDCGL